MKKKKAKSVDGDIFQVPLLNGKVCYGQLLDYQMPNIIRVAFFEGPYDPETVISVDEIIRQKVFSKIATDKYFLIDGEWPIVGNAPVLMNIEDFPNEEFRDDDWVGAVHYTATLVESFLNAYYGLQPWDDYFDPNFLDEFLVNPNDKPANLIYSKK